MLDFIRGARAFCLGILEARKTLTTNPGGYIHEYDSGRGLFHSLTRHWLEP